MRTKKKFFQKWFMIAIAALGLCFQSLAQKPELVIPINTEINNIALSPDDKYMATSSSYSSGIINLWDLKSGILIKSISTESNGFYQLEFSSNSLYLLDSSTYSCCVFDLLTSEKILNKDSKQPIATFYDSNSVLCIENIKSNTFLTITEFIEPELTPIKIKLELDTSFIEFEKIIFVNSWIYTFCLDEKIRIFNDVDGSLIKTLPTQIWSDPTLKISDNGDKLMIYGKSKTTIRNKSYHIIEVWDQNSFELLKVIKNEDKETLIASFIENDKSLLIVTNDFFDKEIEITKTDE